MELSAWQDLLTATLEERVLIFDLFGRLVHGHPKALKRSRLSGGRDLKKVYPAAWPLFEEVMHANRARMGLRLEADQGEIVVDVLPMRRPDQPRGVLCLVRSGQDRGGVSGSGPWTQDLKAILESSPDGLWICDGQANVVQINKTSQRLNQISAAEVIGRNMRDLVAKGYFDRSITLEALEKREPVTWVQTTRRGKRLLSTGNPIFNEKGDIIMVVTNERDLSEIDRLRDEIMSKTVLSQRYQEELIDRQVGRLIQGDIIFRSPAMSRVVETAIRVAKVDSTVLITGPSGAGKEMIADLIHRHSPRAENLMVKVNCGAVPETLFESELFGYEPGAFTGARRQGKPGLVEVADKGTLFLDEVAEIPWPAQVKLLRFLDDGLVFRVGATAGRQVEARVIAATNQNLEEMVAQKRFRQDLYYRLTVIPVVIPPLKERREDIPALTEHYIRRFGRDFGMAKTVSARAMDRLTAYDFPGNVRELINLCEWLMVMSQGPRITPQDLPQRILDARLNPLDPETEMGADQAKGRSLNQRLNDYERAVLVQAVSQQRTQEEVARALGVNQSTVARKMRKYGLSFSSSQP